MFNISKEYAAEKLLLLQIAKGNEYAFKGIYDKYEAKVYSFSIRILKSSELAEEVVQETFLKLWDLGDALKDINNLDCYLKRMARNKTIDILRQKALNAKTISNLKKSWTETHNETEEEIMLNDVNKILNSGIKLLPPQQKLVYQICHLEGKKYEDAALRLNLSTNTIHFSSIANIMLNLFVFLVPYGLLNDFNKLGVGTLLEGYSIWLNIPFAILLTWVFNSLDVVGDSSTNPFEGSPNDVPITNISRTIEIDMRDMLDESDLPPAIMPENNILM